MHAGMRWENWSVQFVHLCPKLSWEGEKKKLQWDKAFQHVPTRETSVITLLYPVFHASAAQTELSEFLHTAFMELNLIEKQIDKTEESYFSINLEKESLGPPSDLQRSQSQQRSDLLIPQLVPPAPPGGHLGSPQSDETHQLPSAIRIWPGVTTCPKHLLLFMWNSSKSSLNSPFPNQSHSFIHSLCAGSLN